MAVLDSRPPSSLEQDIRRLRDWQRRGRHADAIAEATALLVRFPDNRDLILLAAIGLRHLGRIDQALAMLDRLEARQGQFSLLHQERGLCLVQRRDAAAAIDSLLRAVNLNPALPASWSMLEGLYRLTADSAKAATAGAHVATLKALPAEVVAATALYHDGDLALAEPMIRAFLLTQGDHPEAMRLLAKIGMAQGVLDDAEVLLRGVLTLAPDHRAARFELAQVLADRHKYVEAGAELAPLRKLSPDNGDYRSLAATVAVGLGEQARAIGLYRHMAADQPHQPDLYLWLGHALKTIGQSAAAVTAYGRAARLRPDFGDAFWSLANLKLYRFADDDIAAMGRWEAAPATGAVDRLHLCFALGKGLEDRGEFARSWHYYQLGNRLKRAESRYRPEIIETNTARQIEICSRDFFRRRDGWGQRSPDPIFIVGLPRSGSTLLEQILASHSEVDGTQELPHIQRIVVELQGRDPDLDHPRYPAALLDLAEADIMRLGQTYLDDTRVFRAGSPNFIDKMPNNFRHLGLIHLMLPNARIIDARREPMACCFSNLKQLFAQGQEFTYSVEDIARYYRTYLELMRHWDRVLPGRILRVHHEDVVADLQGSVRRLLEHCGLAFEPACIDFHKTSRSVRTPSSEQVRQPIFKDGLDQWKKFDRWLEPLRTALGDALVGYRDG